MESCGELGGEVLFHGFTRPDLPPGLIASVSEYDAMAITYHMREETEIINFCLRKNTIDSEEMRDIYSYCTILLRRLWLKH